MRKPSDRVLWAVFTGGLVIVIAAVIVIALTACQPEAGHKPFPGSTVVPVAASPVAPVPACDDTDGYGPCFYLDDDGTGDMYRFYVAAGGRYPDTGTTRGPRYVPDCGELEAPYAGPCVGQMDLSGPWIYVARGAFWPHGTAVRLCPTANGGPDPCAWVPSFQGNDQGDSGVYLFG